MTAGDLREQVAYDAPPAAVDGPGGLAAGPWDELFRRSARIRALTGSEPVLAQRLTGVQPVIITLRWDSDTRAVTTAGRFRNIATGALYNIRAVTPDEHRAYIDFLCEAGVAS